MARMMLSEERNNMAGGQGAALAGHDALLYCNQFALGPSFIEALPSWQRMRVGESFCLTAHPDLNIMQARSEKRLITLLGFILDPADPSAGDADILERLVHLPGDRKALIKDTYKFGGRWTLILNEGEETALFHDAVGLRQVFYTDVRVTGELWCASQPGLIAEFLRLQMDDDAVDFMNSYEFRTDYEFRWPGDSTPFGEVRHLLPNHFLDLKTGMPIRYWPDAPLSVMSCTEAVDRSSAILQGLLKAAANRFDLALSVTAGLDSRLVLAASRPFCDLIDYMTVRQIRMPDDHADISTPLQLLSQLGLKHNVVKSSLIIDDEYLNVFKKNVPVAHAIYAPDAYAIFRRYRRKKVVVTGSTSEVSRSSFRALLGRPKYAKVTVEDFSLLQGMGNHPFARKHYEQWLAGVGEAYNVDVLNLFEWELDDGNWLAMCQTEFDIAWRDIFTPFNCRDLITCLLSVEEQHMKYPDYEVYRKLILNMWPEVLSVPINPHKQKKEESLLTIVGPLIRSRLSRHMPHLLKKGLKAMLRI
jgi:hypothetical protein